MTDQIGSATDSAQAPKKRTRLSADARRAAILDVAESLFAELSFAEVSTSAIARECGISEGLVFHHFSSKAELYAAVVARRQEALVAAAQESLSNLAPNSSVRDKVHALLGVYLDHIAERPLAWAAVTRGDTPPEAQYIRTEARDTDAAALIGMLPRNPRAAIAVPGFLGFVDAACLDWVDEGCPADGKQPLIETSLGALEGALGDWG